jgi:hypothetical protein
MKAPDRRTPSRIVAGRSRAIAVPPLPSFDVPTRSRGDIVEHEFVGTPALPSVAAGLIRRGDACWSRFEPARASRSPMQAEAPCR